ncbi:MAG TPA: cytochrome b/b6 domain-containing protein [Anaeromyxobacteraceae bacterium]|nr:cytochrome b/b6 domain-containing protein [Anaeromyxobacteraceae bacterium]
MRPIFLVAAALFLSGEAAAADAPKPSPDNQACLDCHEASKPGEAGVRTSEFLKSVHGELACTDCHAGYAAPGPHELPPLQGEEKALAERYGQALRPKRDPKGRVLEPPVGKPLEMEPVSAAPRAFLACATCHPDVVEGVRASVHGRWLRGGRPVAGPTCADCHGAAHALAKAGGGGSAEARARSSRCQVCHDDPRFTEAAGLKGDVVLTFRDSIHGRLVALGSERAPACADCHGSHAIPPKADAVSPVALPNRAKTCAQCHPGANQTFASVVSHRPLHESESKVPHFVHVMFSWLTTLTLLFFAVHVLIDFVYELRKRLARRKEHLHDPEAEVMVQRFDIHQRIQHWLMLTGVILLGLTGWPLRGAGAPEAVETSRKFLALFGGPHGAGVVHRVAAVMIIVSGAYHLVYLTFLAAKKRLPLSMLPGPKDALDMRDNLLYMLGVSKQKPRFDRYNYLEKFDYWAVFWGIVMMVGSGFVFWFPVFFAKFLPAWLLAATQIIHGEEATLAILFLFCVHFYNVHLKPSIFPMSWIWLNGKISLEAMRDEHPAEYQRLKERQ